jgi:hypothetical protein
MSIIINHLSYEEMKKLKIGDVMTKNIEKLFKKK